MNAPVLIVKCEHFSCNGHLAAASSRSAQHKNNVSNFTPEACRMAVTEDPMLHANDIAYVTDCNENEDSNTEVLVVCALLTCLKICQNCKASLVCMQARHDSAVDNYPGTQGH